MISLPSSSIRAAEALKVMVSGGMTEFSVRARGSGAATETRTLSLRLKYTEAPTAAAMTTRAAAEMRMVRTGWRRMPARMLFMLSPGMREGDFSLRYHALRCDATVESTTLPSTSAPPR